MRTAAACTPVTTPRASSPVAAAEGGPAQRTPAARKLQQLIAKLAHAARFPDDEATNELVRTIKGCSSSELALLGLQPPPAPALACIDGAGPLAQRLDAVQSVISALQYNHACGYNFDVGKKRSLQAILATAAGILMHPLPVKCIEAVFLGLLLTQGWTQLLRLPLGFKSKGSNGQLYRHIVLAVADSSSGRYGALGISRCPHLMDKQLVHTTLAALVDDYAAAYRRVNHVLLKVRVGLPAEHDAAYTGPVAWRYCTVSPQKRPWQETAAILNHHAQAAAQLQQQFKAAVAEAAAATAARPRPGPGSCQAIGPHITRPHSPSVLRGAADGRLSPRKLPAAAQASTSSRCSSPAAAPCEGGSARHAAPGHNPHPAAAGSRNTAPDDGEATSDEDNESDSEVNCIVAGMRQRARHRKD